MFTRARGLVAPGVLAIGLAAQPPGVPGTPVPPPDGEDRIVTIEGCLEGVILTPTDLPTQSTLGLPSGVGDRLRLVGDLELMAMLEEHQGQEVSVIGRLLEALDDRQTRGGVMRRIGERTRVWVAGGRAPDTEAPTMPTNADVDLPELELRAVRAVHPSCRQRP